MDEGCNNIIAIIAEESKSLCQNGRSEYPQIHHFLTQKHPAPAGCLQEISVFHVTLCTDHIDNAVHILAADIIGFRLHHNADHRLRAGFPDKDTAGVTQCIRGGLHSDLNIRIILSLRLGVNTDILQKLGIDPCSLQA